MASRSFDQDLYLKLRFKRILFLMGYFSPIEVELSYFAETEPKKRSGLTDLDVLGIKYDPVLTPHRVVGDCKSGKVSDPNRLFWLKGVSEYFGANLAYFLRPHINSHARAIAPKLGLRTIDEQELSNLEQNLRADTLVLPIADPKYHLMVNDLWGIDVPAGAKPTNEELQKKKVYQYLSYEYWYVEQHRNLFMLVDRFESIAHLLKDSNPRDVLLAYAGLERFAHCLLETGSYIYSRGTADLPSNARIYLFGGPLALREREQLFAELQKLRLPGFDPQLDPKYLPDVIELLGRVLRNPHSATLILPYLEAIYGWCVILKNNDLGAVFNSNLDTGGIVLGRDMCITFCRAAGLSEKLFSALLSL